MSCTINKFLIYCLFQKIYLANTEFFLVVTIIQCYLFVRILLIKPGLHVSVSTYLQAAPPAALPKWSLLSINVGGQPLPGGGILHLLHGRSHFLVFFLWLKDERLDASALVPIQSLNNFIKIYEPTIL